MMKKTLLIILGLFVVMVGAERMVLGELFTSTTCPPCVSGNATLNNILSQKGDYLAVVRYHMSWPSPGNDPWYNYPAMKGANDNRRSHYGVNSVPSLVVDGGAPSSSQGMWAVTIDDSHGADSPFDMRLYRDFADYAITADPRQGEGTVCLELTNESEDEISCKIYGALTQSNWQYTGTNGDPTHNQVVIDMIPYSFGQDVTVGPGETKILTYDYEVEDTVDILDVAKEPTGDVLLGDAEECELVFWCQDFTTKKVFQAAKVAVPGDELPLSVSGTQMVDNSGDDVLEADETAEIHVTLTNDDSKKKSNVRAILQVDNDDVIVENAVADVGSLNAGQGLTLDGGELSIKAGPDYDGAFFTITVYAGADDGTYGFEAKSSDVEEKPNNDAAFSIPSIARTGSVLNFAPGTVLNGQMKIELFDVTGSSVTTLYHGSASDISQLTLPAVAQGLYFIRIEADSYTRTARIVLVD